MALLLWLDGSKMCAAWLSSVVLTQQKKERALPNISDMYKVTALKACKQAEEQSHPTSRMQGCTCKP
jgi:hypothetical protein